MENERLRTTITRAGLTLEEFASIVGVDVKTVQRWLGGRNPYPHNRSTVAAALDTTEHALWPDAVPAPPDTGESDPITALAVDPIAGYAHATNPEAPNSLELLRAAVERIEIVLPNLSAEPDLVEQLRTSGINGCPVRIIILAPDERVEPLLGIDAIEVRASPGGERHVLYRADDELLLLLTHIGSAGVSPPIIHLCRQADGGLFDRLSDDFEDRWLEATPITSREQLHASTGNGQLDRDPGPARVPETDPLPPTSTTAALAEAPRRWPRRPT